MGSLPPCLGLFYSVLFKEKGDFKFKSEYEGIFYPGQSSLQGDKSFPVILPCAGDSRTTCGPEPVVRLDTVESSGSGSAHPPRGWSVSSFGSESLQHCSPGCPPFVVGPLETQGSEIRGPKGVRARNFAEDSVDDNSRTWGQGRSVDWDVWVVNLALDKGSGGVDRRWSTGGRTWTTGGGGTLR